MEKILYYSYREKLVDQDKPIYFSLAGEGDIATINLHTGETDTSGDIQNISWRLEEYALRRREEVYALALALLNAIIHGSRTSPSSRKLYKECWRKHQSNGAFPIKDLYFSHPRPEDHGPYTKIYKTHCKVLAKDKPLNLSLHSCRTRLHHQLSLNQQNGKKMRKSTP